MPAAVVVGAGVFGAALADRLARDGWDVTLVDRFEPGDPRSESGGETRLLRYAHGSEEFYARSAAEARAAWVELGVLEETGAAWFVRRAGGWEADSERTLRAVGIPVERLDPAAAERLFPSLNVADLDHVMLEPTAGVLHAGDGVRALVARAREQGVRLERGTAAPDGDGVLVEGRRLEADHVVWACGAWLADLFPGLVKLRVTRQELVLFDAPAAWAAAPAWLEFDASRYGHALIEPHGVKVGSDREGPLVDPDARPAEAGPEGLAAAREYLAHRFPALAGARVRSAPVCHYSLTADANFVFAGHPEHERTWLLGGGSGHGYKHGPALAAHVAAVLSGTAQPEPRFALGERAPSAALRTAQD